MKVVLITLGLVCALSAQAGGIYCLTSEPYAAMGRKLNVEKFDRLQKIAARLSKQVDFGKETDNKAAFRQSLINLSMVGYWKYYGWKDRIKCPEAEIIEEYRNRKFLEYSEKVDSKCFDEVKKLRFQPAQWRDYAEAYSDVTINLAALYFEYGGLGGFSLYHCNRTGFYFMSQEDTPFNPYLGRRRKLKPMTEKEIKAVISYTRNAYWGYKKVSEREK